MVSRYRLLPGVFARALLALAGCLLAGSVAIAIAGCQDRLAHADLIVVPGNTIAPDGTPSPRLRARLDAALVLYQSRHAELIFVSGGTGKEGLDEAASMAAYLLAHGVRATAIVQDHTGVDTAATARNAAQFMQQHQFRRALVATQYFHIPRTRLLLEHAGIAVPGNLHATFFEPRDLYSTPREALAFALAWLWR